MDLQTLWFFLWGLLWAVFFMTDGFDFGIGMLYPFLGKNDIEKRIMINSIGPLWDGNEVWLITAGGVTFAAFPLAYAVMFSSLYSGLMFILFALILRGVAFEFRNKVDKQSWRIIWDTCITAGSLVPALLFGITFANIFKGLPLDANGVFQGSFFDLLNVYALIGGLLFILLFLFHGAVWLAIKTEGDLHNRAHLTAVWLWPFVLICAVLFLVASWRYTKLFDNFIYQPALFLEILLIVAALFASRFFIKRNNYFKAWFASSVTIVGAVFFGIIGLYPNILPSSISSDFNVTAFNSSSSPLTLKIMLIVVIIFIPVVIAYQAWTYNLFKGKITEKDLSYEEAY
ncbi:cytochrome d ubiquinol oxidase subunit II [Desulfobacterium sp. N47]|uniref:Cytochrome d ubiquinol oxidase, subunit II n=1 Tax=uncultured Desulfobacterium sp. TaxID=201089 RepID=E1Y947_9BACT|nr:hypothetical protein N47_A11200 [uncultured Desulfobacterium sp.]